jgi:hypothetical protein
MHAALNGRLSMRDNGPLTVAARGADASLAIGCVEWRMELSPDAVQGFKALAIGFAFAGLVASAFELFTQRRASFHLLKGGGLLAVASVPMVVFAAPFLILRNTVRGRAIEGRPIHFVMLATIIAGFWSLVCGHVVIDLFSHALRLS